MCFTEREVRCPGCGIGFMRDDVYETVEKLKAFVWADRGER